MDCKFNIGDHVFYKNGPSKHVYIVIGRTEYSRKKTIYCGKDRLFHEPTYALVGIDLIYEYALKGITDVYGVPFYSCCREHHITLKQSCEKYIKENPFKYNLNDYVVLKNSEIVYKITARTEWYGEKEPSYELMRTTESDHIYFEHRSEDCIEMKVED